jgi:hypothetical protein
MLASFSAAQNDALRFTGIKVLLADCNSKALLLRNRFKCILGKFGIGINLIQ